MLVFEETFMLIQQVLLRPSYVLLLLLPCPQSLSEHSMHTPLYTQWWSGLSVGMRMNMRKLELWPVVASTPLRSAVRYTGQS